MILANRRQVLSIFAFAVILFSAGCAPNKSILESSNRNSPTQPGNLAIEKSSLEQDLDAMGNADFKVVFVLRRRDGAEFDAVDKAVVRQNTAQANRRVASEGGRAVIVGSNFPLDPAGVDVMKERFLFEDHSPPVGASNSNSNAAN
jgi:hypothetical protein